MTRQTLRRLVDHYEVQVIGYAKPESDRLAISGSLPYQVHVSDRYDDNRLFEICKQFEPDVLLCSHDVFMFAALRTIKQLVPKMKIVGWFTIDGDPLPQVYRQIFNGCDLVVTPTHYGKNIIQSQYFDTAVHVIPYGIDHEHYKPSDRKTSLEFLKSNGIVFAPSLYQKVENSGTFVAIFWGHNHSKKNIPALVEAWKAADIDRTKAHLLLVVHSHEVVKGQIKSIGDWDYTNEIIVEEAHHITLLDNCFKDEKMSRIVQLANSVLFPSIGEGFGLPPLEGMACGAVPIVTNYAGTNDFCRHADNAFLIGGEHVAGEFGIRRLIASKKDLQKRIEEAFMMHQEPEKMFSVGSAYGAGMLNARLVSDSMQSWNRLRESALATAKEFQWDKSASEWHILLQKMMSGSFERNLVHTRI